MPPCPSLPLTCFAVPRHAPCVVFDTVSLAPCAALCLQGGATAHPSDYAANDAQDHAGDADSLLAELVAERDEIRGRVARLLGRIERWQDEQPSAGQGPNSGQLLTGEPD